MDWLSDHKAEIICHKKVVRIPLLDMKVLRVLGEKLEEKVRQLMSAKAKEKKQEKVIVVKDFPEVFPDDLSGLPPVQEIDFCIELALGAMPVAKSPYHLAPSELEELHVINGGGIHVDPSKIVAVKNWKTFRTSSEENAFQTLKDKLCNAHVLALPDGPEDFVVYCDASGQKELNMQQRRWIELFSNYDCKIRYHSGKANVVDDVLSRKERVKPKRVRAMNMTLQLSIKDRILAAQKEASDDSVGLQRAHKLKYSVHPGSDKTYYDLRDRYWWSGMKKDIAVYISMDFVTKLPRISSGYDTIWVIVDRLTIFAHFLPMREDYKMDRLARLYLNEIVARHDVPISIISDRDNDGQSERTIQTLEDMRRACVLDFEGSWDVHLILVEFSYNNSYHSSVRCMSFEALYGRKCRSSIMWAEVGEVQLIRPELVQETTEKISKTKNRLKVTHDHQKSYADKRRKPLEFSIGDYVLLKVSPWKGVVRFGKKGKLAPRFVEPFKIIEKVGPVDYQLNFPEELNGVHDTFRVSNLKKCLADPTLQVPFDKIRVDAKLNFMEEPIEILEREFKKLKRSGIAIIKVWWNSNVDLNSRENVKIR
nr:putative reverse transcriptase domain-containing protein [Tanacetum cinerariifolium]